MGLGSKVEEKLEPKKGDELSHYKNQTWENRIEILKSKLCSKKSNPCLERWNRDELKIQNNGSFCH